MEHIIAESSLDAPLSLAEEKRTSKAIDEALLKSGSYWLRSFVSRDRMRIIAEFEGGDVTAVEAAYREAGLDLNRVWLAQVQTLETVKAD
jgi:hypothetical protein